MATKGFSATTGGSSTKPKKMNSPTSGQTEVGGKPSKSIPTPTGSLVSANQPKQSPPTPTGSLVAANQPAPALAIMPHQGVPSAGSTSDAQRNPSSGGGGGGGGVPNAGVAGFNQGTTDPITGAIAGYGYTPQGLGMLYDNPEILANDLLAKMGITNPGMAKSLGQYMDPAVAANFLIGKGMGSSSSDSETLNFANEYLKQMATPNGRTPEFDYLVNALLGASGQESPLNAYLNAGLTPEQQIQAANALFGQTLVGLNPYAQQAYSRYAKDQGNQYLGGVAKGAPGGESYLDYLNTTPLSQWVNR